MIHRPRHPVRPGAGSLVAAAVVAIVVGIVAPSAPVAAHEPDPMIGTRLWSQDQVVTYAWRSSAMPPAWLQTAFDAGAADLNESRGSRAATFVRLAGSASLVGYGDNLTCPAYAIACFDRSGVPKSFIVWFRPNGWWYDWGQLRWCEAIASSTDRCYEAENVALDELGHVEILWHHVNRGDQTDFLDAVVQAASHTRPGTGWNEHVLGRCDVARLQLEYELPSMTSRVSTCLAAPTSAAITASQTSAVVGETVTFAASLRFAVDAANRALSGDRLAGRALALQRRAPGGTSWATVATFGTSPDGTYSASWSPTATYDWRVTFAAPSDEGLLASSSAAVRVAVTGCTGTGCPSAPDLRQR